MRVLTIFVRHGTEKYARSEQDLTGLFHAQLPDVRRDTVIVDTALPAGEFERRLGRVVIGGDNSASEFSGFDSGLRFAADRLQTYDLVNLATSAFRQSYVDYLERFRTDVLESIVGKPVCLGHIDCYNEGIEVLGQESQHWVRTSCLFVSPVQLKTLGTMVSTGDCRTWFSGDALEPFRRDAPLSATYRRLITDWLSGHDIGQGAVWHTPIRISASSLGRFEQKAAAILNEHLLGVRLRAAGCRTIDVTWLSGVIAKRPGAPVDWDTPWWRQLADRDRHAVKVDVAGRKAS
jgi:hypothetical protein